jgi:hypothetical protein
MYFKNISCGARDVTQCAFIPEVLGSIPRTLKKQNKTVNIDT